MLLFQFYSFFIWLLSTSVLIVIQNQKLRSQTSRQPVFERVEVDASQVRKENQAENVERDDFAVAHKYVRGEHFQQVHHLSPEDGVVRVMVLVRHVEQILEKQFRVDYSFAEVLDFQPVVARSPSGEVQQVQQRVCRADRLHGQKHDFVLHVVYLAHNCVLQFENTYDRVVDQKLVHSVHKDMRC
ncbi:Hypothetical_protein [Hexamita inflata]|uniref:Hypothetical_protein n=1 Tax=Hexamita inflata TaxID=28002 RepID=A0AA86QQL0_9EUKA|nr:Hypothetical protein HINF_LOCUS48822 [Hexamita inflata]